MIDLYTKDDKEIIVKWTLQSTVVLELDQILDIWGPQIPSWGKLSMCSTSRENCQLLKALSEILKPIIRRLLLWSKLHCHHFCFIFELFFALFETFLKLFLFIYQNCMTHNIFGVIDAILGDQNLDMLVLRKTKLKLAKIPCQIENIQFYKIFNFSAIFGSIKKVK